MAGKQLTIRLTAEALDQLEAESQRRGQTRAEVAQTLIEEGLRIARHPGIEFRPGPTGRRAALTTGPDVWEVIAVYRELQRKGAKDPIEETVTVTGVVSRHEVETAVHYYAEYAAEIDDRIDANERAAEEGYAEWLREQASLHV